jgi:hypothetical protein
MVERITAWKLNAPNFVPSLPRDVGSRIKDSLLQGCLARVTQQGLLLQR